MISSTYDPGSSTNGSFDVTWMKSGCVAVTTNSSVYNLTGSLISDDVQRLIDRLKGAVFIPMCFVIGSPTNCMSLVVFYRHGFSNRINLSLFILAFVDLLSTTFDFILYAERMYNQFTSDERLTVVYSFALSNRFLGFYGSQYAAMILVAIIACDRCLCILLPIKAKIVVSVRLTAVIIFVALATTYTVTFVIVLSYRIVCLYDFTTNVSQYESVYTDFYIQNKAIMTALENIFIGFLISIGCPLTVFVATIIMISKLMKTVKWRKNTTSSESSKEIALTRMLLALSVEFLVLSVPHFLFWMTPLFIHDFRDNTSHRNTQKLLMSLLQVASNIRSCANFFVYYTFGSRYRQSVRSMICSGKSNGVKLHAKK